MQIVKKYYSNNDVRLKRNSGGMEICGFGSVYGEPDFQKDIIEVGAFDDGLEEDRRNGIVLPILAHHQQSKPIGRWLHLENKVDVQNGVERHGLWCEGFIAEGIKEGKELIDTIRIVDLSGLSVGFIVLKWRKSGSYTVIEKAKLLEISVVTNPAMHFARFSEKKPAEVKEDEI